MSVLISWLSVGYRILLAACSCRNGTEFPQSSLRGRSYTGGKRCDLPIWGSENSDWGKMAIQSSPFHPSIATGHRDLLKLLTPCFSYWFQEDNNTKPTLLKTSPFLKKKKKFFSTVQTPKQVVINKTLFFLSSTPGSNAFLFLSMPFSKPLTFHCASSLPSSWIMPICQF